MHEHPCFEVVSEGLERVSDAARFLGLSRSHVYRLMASGVLPFVKIGKSRRVPIRAVRELACHNLTHALKDTTNDGEQ